MIEQVQIRSLKSGGDLIRDRGMIESVRQQWLYSTQACAAIHDGNVPQVRSVSSGLAASEDDGIKCDETEKVVSEIQGSFDSVYVRNATIKETSDGAHPE